MSLNLILINNPLKDVLFLPPGGAETGAQPLWISFFKTRQLIEAKVKYFLSGPGEYAPASSLVDLSAKNSSTELLTRDFQSVWASASSGELWKIQITGPHFRKENQSGWAGPQKSVFFQS